MIVGVALLIVLMILPLSALVARRMPMASWVRMLLAWLAIFAGAFLIVSLWQAVTADRGVLHPLFG